MQKIPQTILSGIKPTGRPHLGNYFGAMKQWVELSKKSDEARLFFMIVDYHALNFIQNAGEMRQSTLDLAIDFVALGLDPAKVTLFKQSDVSAHTELAWIFETITTMPYLMRAHAFKDAEAKNKDISAGTFNYPMLMAADMLLYDADVVPVGQDQKQHIEFARDTAEKFNRIFGETFKLPEPMILDSVAIVPGIDGQKMSKSYGNTIPLFASDEEIEKAVMSIVTDSSGEVPVNVYAIHKLFRTEAELAPLYEANKGKYKALKDALIADVQAFVKPLRDKRAEISGDPARIQQILKEGAEKAQAVAQAKLIEVKKKIGVL